MSFGTRLRHIMKVRGVSQVALGNYVGVESQAVAQWVSRVKETTPHQSKLRKIAECLGVSVPDLMAEDGAPFGNNEDMSPMLVDQSERTLVSRVRAMEPHRARAIRTLAGVEDDNPQEGAQTPKRSPRKPVPRPTPGGNAQKNRTDEGCNRVVMIQDGSRREG